VPSLYLLIEMAEKKATPGQDFITGRLFVQTKKIRFEVGESLFFGPINFWGENGVFSTIPCKGLSPETPNPP
jgi:hypothetical protein